MLAVELALHRLCLGDEEFRIQEVIGRAVPLGQFVALGTGRAPHSLRRVRMRYKHGTQFTHGRLIAAQLW